ncbi:hypothetical protein GA840_00185 [Pediococcus ethanolidurans]|uniref:DUF6978 family protein n=1 Tax=Pediococcus ethanolidurans TaxID=319653 RepID=UPI002954238C|nr:hypothetical protein [Pediococcus ethanolidurans]MDV7718305.1 hypothetical protein [Pediococcus ethanolidurans]
MTQMKNTSIDRLAPKDVEKLIQEIKKFLNHSVFHVPNRGRFVKEKSIIGTRSQIYYKFGIYRGNLTIKYSLHIRFFRNNVHLIRLCVNGSRHHNEDGSVIGPNHVHIYSFHDKHIESKAFNFSNFPFNELDSLEEAIIKFEKLVQLK